MILQTYPKRLYFSALRPLALAISSYEEFRSIPEHQDYSRLKQRCRQKFLQETVTKTLVVKGSLALTDLTSEVSQMGSGPVCHGGFADVWKALWSDPVERKTKKVAVKVLRQIMVKNVKEKLMKVRETLGNVFEVWAQFFCSVSRLKLLHGIGYATRTSTSCMVSSSSRTVSAWSLLGVITETYARTSRTISPSIGLTS
jgi:hypothetical protein